jgi:hypothetical protein
MLGTSLKKVETRNPFLALAHQKRFGVVNLARFVFELSEANRAEVNLVIADLLVPQDLGLCQVLHSFCEGLVGTLADAKQLRHFKSENEDVLIVEVDIEGTKGENTVIVIQEAHGLVVLKGKSKVHHFVWGARG